MFFWPSQDKNSLTGVGFKSMIILRNIAGPLGDSSKEVKIKLTEPYTIIEVFFLQRADGDNQSRRSDRTQVLMGHDAADFSPNNIQITDEIFGGGFKTVTTPISA